MYSGDNTCRKKILFICSFFLSVLLSFAFALRPLYASAIDPNHYAAHFTTRYDNSQSWQRNISLNTDFYPWYLYDFDWIIDSVNFSGNYANVHFETNLVLHGSPTGSPQTSVINGRWKNLDFLRINYCGSSGSNFTVRSQNITYYKTPWYGNTPTFDDAGEESNNVTLTIIGDVVLGDVPTSGSHELYCGVGTTNDWAFMEAINVDSPYSPVVYFEQSPVRVTFTTDYTEALDNQRNAILENINNSIQDLNNQYDKEKEDLENKGSDLEDQADGLSLSASITSNPFTSLFYDNPFNNGTRCWTTQQLHLYFNSSSWSICSPFPNTVRIILNYVNSLFVIGLLIRLYYKKLKGGVDG